MIIGTHFVNFEVREKSLSALLSNGMQVVIEEDPRNRAPRHGGDLRAFDPGEDLRRAVFLSPTPVIWI